jgi:hypothetical protein
MIDTAKRNTLKALITGAGYGLLPATAAATATGTTSAPARPFREFGVAELLISIEDNSVLFANLTDQPVQLRHFAPGSVLWGDAYLDLNALNSPAAKTLAPFTSERVDARITTRSRSFSEGIWADEAVLQRSNGRQSVLLGAYSHHSQLHVFPIPSISVQTSHFA